MYNSGNTITHWVLIERKCFMYIEYTQNSTIKSQNKTISEIQIWSME